VTLYSSDVRESDGLVVLGSATEARITTKLTYDSFGNLKTRTEAVGRAEERTTSYDYDKLGRQIKVTYPQIMVAAKPAATLAASLLLGADARDEIAFSPTAQTYYDAFGNAVASTVSGPDRTGITNYKSYDAAGRVSFEIDALGYITGYTRNAFGEATAVKRYAVATKLNATAAADADTALTTAVVSAAVNAAGVDHSEDRVLATAYDKAGRVIQVNELKAYTYDATTGEGDADGGKITKSGYNAFGELIKVSELVNRTRGTWADTTHYYDLGSRRKATVDAMGYLTTRSFDRVGNLTGQTEFDNALTAGSWDTAAYAAVTPDAERDRASTWTWDKLDRKLSETQKNALHSTASNGSSLRADLSTRYAYDAVGNLIATTDAAGGVTRTYYDALGRIRAVLAPARSSTTDGETVIPVIEFRRDAHGNVVCRIERSNTATAVTATSFTSVYESTDRYTSTVYDAAGNATQVYNADRAMQYSTYTADGKLAKAWRTVTDNDGAKTTLFTAYGYDKLGRLLNSYSPSPASPTAVVSTNFEYNAFGEVVRKGKNSGWQESFEYDNAGRLWKTNSQGGIAKVFLYNLRGQQTAEISSAGSGRAGSVDVAAATSAAQAAGWSNTRRVNIKVDLLGRVIERAEAERVVRQGGITLRKASATAAVVASAQAVYSGPGGSRLSWSGENSVRLSWTNLGYLGSGEIRVDLTYASKPVLEGAAASTLSESQIFQGHEAAAGVTMRWSTTSSMMTSSPGGISAVERLVVYKKNADGAWIKVIDRSPEGDRPFGAGNQLAARPQHRGELQVPQGGRGRLDQRGVHRPHVLRRFALVRYQHAVGHLRVRGVLHRKRPHGRAH
jgi:YD repeat-containing protein